MTTGIEWTDETWNPLVGCKAVSPGCDHCYAARQTTTTNYTFDFSMGPGGIVPGSMNPDGQVTNTGEGLEDNCGNGFGETDEFGYDQAGRLNTVIRLSTFGDKGSANDVVADPAGNDTSIYTFNGGSTQTFDNADEQLTQTTSGTTTNFANDTIGDQTSATVGSSVTSSAYDQLGRMTTYTAPSGTSTAYTYNGDGLEASNKPSGGALGQLLWNQSSPTPTLLSDGSDYFIYGPGQTPVEQFNTTSSPPTSNPTFINTSARDGINAYVVTNTSGEYTNFWVYDPFGNIGNPGSEGSSFGYAGQYTDVASSNPSGLVNMRARWYEPSTGTFTRVDPDLTETGQPYAYANDDPVNELDPSGDCGCTEAAGTAEELIAGISDLGVGEVAQTFAESFLFAGAALLLGPVGVGVLASLSLITIQTDFAVASAATLAIAAAAQCGETGTVP